VIASSPVGQIVTRMANAWPRRQQAERLLEREPDLHCSVSAVSGYEVSDGLDVRLGSLGKAVRLASATRPVSASSQPRSICSRQRTRI
jgi:DNA-binding GntR family transcriptional regulator